MIKGGDIMYVCSASMLFLPVVAAALLALAPAAMASPRSSVGHGGAVLVDGQPRLILGLYENPADDARLKQAVDAGFNLFYCGASESDLDRLHRVGAMGWINTGGDIDLSVDPAARRERLVTLARRFAKHPALLLWEGPDEALWNNWHVPMETIWTAEAPAMDAVCRERAGADADALRTLRDLMADRRSRALWDEAEKARRAFWQKAGVTPPPTYPPIDDMARNAQRMAKGMSAGIRALHDTDPDHMVWLNHAPRNSLASLRLYNAEADMAGCDIYPAPANLLVGHSDLVNKRITSVGDYTDRMRRAAPGKACAMVLQGFGWNDISTPKAKEEIRRLGVGRRPTFKESRFMAYNALMHGANAILYWGTAYAKEPTPEETAGSQTASEDGCRMWQDLLAVARELRALEPALVAPEAARLRVIVEETYASIDGGGVRTSLRRAGTDWVLLVANENEDGVAFTAQGLPAEMQGLTLYRLGAPETVTVRDGTIRDGIAALNVHVYATSRRFEPVPRDAR
jgi:hypothetical protein